MKLWSIIVAAGSGSRFGGHKQLQPLGDRRVVDWSVDLLSSFGNTVVVGPAAGESASNDETSAAIQLNQNISLFVAGGVTRSDSVRSGLEAVATDATHILIHDAARPLLSVNVIERVLEALRHGASAAIPVVPVTDSLRSVTGQPVDRQTMVAVQTPQGFACDTLRQAYATGRSATDDATLVSQSGGNVVHVEGDPLNFKITLPHDLITAQALVDSPLAPLTGNKPRSPKTF